VKLYKYKIRNRDANEVRFEIECLCELNIGIELKYEV
jgi:hypothetical protein